MVDVNDKWSILQTCACTLNYVVSYNGLGVFEPFDGACLGHAPSKACQYIIFNDKVALGFNYASIKFT
jgi:hypothetical protein